MAAGQGQDHQPHRVEPVRFRVAGVEAESGLAIGPRILHSTGDERNALLMLTVEADFGAGRATLPGARLYLLDDNNKIQTEHVIFYAAGH